jgi:translation initiation factor IF-2
VAAKPAPAAPAKAAPAGIGNRPASSAPAPKSPGQRHHLPHRKDRENLTALKQPPKPQPAPAPKVEAPAAGEEKKVIKLPESVTVAELADRMGLKSVELIKKLMEYKIFATINQRLANDVAQTLALDFGFETEMMGLYGEDLLAQEQDVPERMVTRPPVVTIMGHVDHGKTSLLDAIRKTDVAGGESGGITQHIGAYRVHLEGKGDVVFLDTPGHAAFTQMRARGAAVTDVVVLVVAADDGVQPQTLEAIDHAKAANVPIVVAINKIDKEGANPDRVMQELAKHNLLPEEWGGKTIYVQVSAKKRLHLDRLLELLVLQSALLELKADPIRNGKGVVIEAKLDKGRGPVATVLVQTGTVHVGDLFVAGNFMGHVRALINDKGKKVEAAGPATPVEVLGFSGVPDAGDGFNVVTSERIARQISQNRMEAQKERDRNMRGHVKLDGLFDQISQGDLKELKIIIKADVSGSAEAIKDELERLPSDKVKVRVIHAGVGTINESDVSLADASDALVLGFHTRVEGKGNEMAKEKTVEVRLYDVIYDLVNDVKTAMEGLLTPQYRDVVVGKAEVRGIFKAGGGLVAGAYITSGKAERKHNARLLRGEAEIWKGKISSLRRFKDDVKEVTTGMECGVGLEGCGDIQVGDQIEFFTIETVAQKL